MSRYGRATDLLSQWRDHPRGCTADHGFADGYDGPCTDDEQEIIKSLDEIDPWFCHDEIARLRKKVEADPARLSKMLWEAREQIEMWADVASRTGRIDDTYVRGLVVDIDTYRAERGWSPNGYGGET